LAAGGAAIWYLGLQLLWLRAWCIYCAIAHVLGIALVLVAYCATSGGPRVSIELTLARSTLSVIAAILVTLLVGGQLLLRPRLYAINRGVIEKPVITESDNSRPKLLDDIERKHGRSAMLEREIRLVGGRVLLRSGAWPVLGPLDSSFTIACLMDFTCPSCRHVYRLLAEAVERCKPMLSVILVPVPQDSACNPMARSASAHGNACGHARLALAAWAADRSKYSLYVRWLFASDSPPSIEVASAYASSLFEWSDPLLLVTSMDQWITRAIEIHTSSRTGKIPTILLPRATVSGEVPSTDELLRILDKELGLKRATSL